jgi:hypothetical protein
MHEKAEQSERLVAKRLSEIGATDIRHTGVHRRYPAELVRALQQRTDVDAITARHEPDLSFRICDRVTHSWPATEISAAYYAWCEVKTGHSISRESYESCIRWQKNGAVCDPFLPLIGSSPHYMTVIPLRYARTPVMIAVLDSRDPVVIRWQWIDHIRFLDSHAVVAEYPVPHPVCPEGWITPEGKSHGSFGSMSHTVASGMPHKRFDLDSFRWCIDGFITPHPTHHAHQGE